MRHWATVGGSALGCAVGWNISNMGAVADQTAVAYGVSLAVVGVFTTALFVSHAALQIPAGRAIDRFGPRRAGFVALGVLGLANGLALIAPEPGLAIPLRALAGVGTALGFIGGLDYVRRHGGSPFTQGLYGGLSLGVGGIALAVVPQVEDAIGWRAPWATALAVAAVAVVALAIAPADVARPRQAHPADGAAHAPGLLRDRRLLRLCVLYMTSFGLAVILGNWVVTLLSRAGDYSPGTAGAVGSLVLLVGVVSRPLGGWLSRRYPARMRSILAVSIAASAAGTLLLAAAGPLALSLLGALVVGIGSGIPFASSFVAAVRIRPEAPGAAVGVVNMAANILIVVGTPLLGLTFSLPGDGRIGFLVAAAASLSALAVVPAVRELDAARP